MTPRDAAAMTEDEIAREVARAASRYGVRFWNGAKYNHAVYDWTRLNARPKLFIEYRQAAMEADRLNGLNAIAVYRRLTEGK